MENRYYELLEGIYKGVAPAWMRPHEIERFRVDSWWRQLHLYRQVWQALPNASFYAAALAEEEFLAGVCGRFASRAPESTSLTAALMNAARDWFLDHPDPHLRQVFLYDSLSISSLRPEPYRGRHHLALRRDAGLPEEFALLFFDIDVIRFTAYLDWLREHHAPRAYVKAQPVPHKRSVVAMYLSGSDVMSRDVTSLVDPSSPAE